MRTTTNNQYIVFNVRPTENRNCAKIVARPTKFNLGGFIFEIELLNSFGGKLDKFDLHITGEVYENWPAGNLASDVAYFKPYILARVNQNEA